MARKGLRIAGLRIDVNVSDKVRAMAIVWRIGEGTNRSDACDKRCDCATILTDGLLLPPAICHLTAVDCHQPPFHCQLSTTIQCRQHPRNTLDS